MATIQGLLTIGGKIIQARDLHAPHQFVLKTIEVDLAVVSALYMLGWVNQLRGRLRQDRGGELRANPSASSPIIENVLTQAERPHL